MALDLHRVCHYAFVQEGGWLDENVLCLLETHQSALFADLVQVYHDLYSDRVVFAEFLVATLNALAGSKLL